MLQTKRLSKYLAGTTTGELILESRGKGRILEGANNFSKKIYKKAFTARCPEILCHRWGDRVKEKSKLRGYDIKIHLKLNLATDQGRKERS